MEKCDILSATVENVVFHNEDNCYTVLDVSDAAGSLITAVGTISMPHEGECVKLYGSWVYHKEFGRQFSFFEYEKTLPSDTDGILQYLSSKTVRGIGPVTALKIVKKYGAESFDVIENHPEWLTDIPGITLKKAAAISASFKEQNGARELIMFCRDFMPSADSMRIYRRFGAGAVGIIKENPYIIAGGALGVSFEVADKIAKSLGHAADSELRVLSGVEYILKRAAAEKGHTALPRAELAGEAAALLEIPENTILLRLDALIISRKIYRYSTGDGDLIMSEDAARAEDYIASRLADIRNSAEGFSTGDISYLIDRAETAAGIEYAEMQRRAIFEAMTRGALVITGGPGTGKTTIIKALTAIFNSMGIRVALAAPTGRAAKRMSEATSHEAKTVHRLLETERTPLGEMRFNKNEKNTLDEAVIIIDEASMLDVYLAEALLRALKRGGRVIFIGDADQLPSVGAGNFLFDLIGSGGVDTIRLTEIFRQSKQSLIVTNAHKINRGEAPVLSSLDNDFFFVRRDGEEDIAATVASLIAERLPKTYGFDIKSKIQVICPSKKGAGGVELINKRLQDTLNPKMQFKREINRSGTVFREGDKVMQTVNNYELEWETGGASGSGVFNGDIGVIEEINEREEYVRILFDERAVKYKYDTLEEIELAYAITVHKSQGSEYPVVILPMYSCAPMLMARNLLYTAVTRAKSMLILVGRPDIAMRMIENDTQQKRYTTLKNRISDYR